MHRTQFGILDQTPKDAILLIELGFHTQQFNSESATGVTLYRLNKSVAAILRHWEALQRLPSVYRGSHYWGIKHTAYRYGQIGYARPSPSDPPSNTPFGVYYLDDIVRRNAFFDAVGVVVNDDAPQRDYEAYVATTRIEFPLPEHKLYGAFKTSSEIDPTDLEIVRQLAILYSKATSEQLAILATCPTEQDAVMAVSNEIRLWIHDIDQILNSIDKLSAPSTSNRNVETENISLYLNSAFECGREVGKKINWYKAAREAAFAVWTEGRKLMPVGDGLLSPLADLSLASTHDPSPRLIAAKELANIMTGYVGLIFNTLSRFGMAVRLSNTKVDIAVKRITALSEEAIPEYSKLAMDLSFSANTSNKNYLIQANQSLRAIYKGISLTLEQKKFPPTCHRDDIFV
ncbi:MAG: hypothetical protein IPK17_30770 [Chloroflexi bacterium]|uniref:hypothetical protein n=1 Tax=Candidatus Flexifilum breve TaxID=3140694 RepID=UPI003135554B|nr:hypothetical protein [Chloroflexota bacterium]